MPTYQYQAYRVTISADGEINVAARDTISGYCAAIYRKPPGSTRSHWGEFGRKDKHGKVKPLANPHVIKAGERLFHIPSSKKTSTEKKIDTTLLTIKLHRLKNVRADGLTVYDQIRKDLLRQQKQVDNFSFGLDMAAVVATAAAGAVKGVATLASNASAADDVAKMLIKRSWGIGFQPQNQGVVQGIVQNSANYGDNLTPSGDDHTVVAIGKILAGSFIDMTSPSYWSKLIAGGDGKDELRQALAANERNRKTFLTRIDASIKKCESQLAGATKKK
jgi:hypothetical protein